MGARKGSRRAQERKVNGCQSNLASTYGTKSRGDTRKYRGIVIKETLIHYSQYKTNQMDTELLRR